MLSLKYLVKATNEEIRLLVKWRKKVQKLWGETFKVTYRGTKKWIDKICSDSKKMFFIIKKDGENIGQIGFEEIGKSYCYIGYVIRGEGKSDGSMTATVKFLINLAIGKKIYLRVLPHNIHAIKFYEKIGFKVIRRGKLLKMKYENSGK